MKSATAIQVNKILDISKEYFDKINTIPIEIVKLYSTYFAYFIIFIISLSSIINTKEYIIDNKQKETNKIIFHSSISIILLWTSIYFLIK